MERPKITKELIAATAAAFCERNGWDSDQAEDIARVCCSAHMDGYELAKELDSVCGWMPTAQDVETLDSFGSSVGEAHKQLCIEWARDNNVQPPLPIGTMTTKGVIAGIYEHAAACYRVKEHGEANDTRFLIVRFEDACAA